MLNLFTLRNVFIALIFLGLPRGEAIAQEIPQTPAPQPWPSITPTTPAAKAKLSEGLAIIQQGNLDGAIAQFQAAIALDPLLWQAHYNLGLALGQRGDLLAAAQAFLETIELQPNFAVAYGNLGGVLIDSQNWPQAEPYLRRALSLDPNLAIAHYNLGLIYRHQGNRDAAIQAWQKARELAPDFPDATIQLAELYLAGDRPEAAQPLIQELLKSQPNLAAVHYLQGRWLAQQGDFAEALQAFRASSERDPTYANAYFAAAQLLIKNNQRAAAMPLLDYAHSLYGQQQQAPWLEAVQTLRQQIQSPKQGQK
ncbi:tetratricopeptide repeat protein [Picosynechococcus sp. PCC 7003]|uniref:tetratricopeptide repeat protein n=1 Tax=Picosynechococcus sp. PCC 7003 TaxID=374981 RepID=UPI000A91825B|nr:tetratricopeptide repeat protein [Picosynechococcus sp. PCC 7003]